MGSYLESMPVENSRENTKTMTMGNYLQHWNIMKGTRLCRDFMVKELLSGRTRFSSFLWLTCQIPLVMQQISVLYSNLDPLLRYTEALQQSVMTHTDGQLTDINTGNLIVPLSCMTQMLTLRNSFRKYDYAFLYLFPKDSKRAEMLLHIFLSFLVSSF